MRWGDPTDCFTEEEERKMEEAYLHQCWEDRWAEMDEAFDALVDGADEALAKLDVTLTKLASEPIDPDTEAMVTAPAATVAGSVSLIDAVRKVA